jgi:AICAR transformylase/IMP cyclohydrolase PurH
VRSGKIAHRATPAKATTISPGGSRRDAEVIAAAGIAMVFTGIHRFRH